MLYIFAGEDSFSLSRALEEVKEGVGDPATLAMSLTVLDGRQVTYDQFKVTCETLPFMSPIRLVIVEGLLAHLSAPGRPRRTRSAPQAGDRADRQASQAAERSRQFISCLENLPETTTVVLVEPDAKASGTLAKDLQKKATMRSFPLLKGPALTQWAQGRITDAGGSIAPGALTLLTRAVGSDLWAMANEIDKLLSFTGGRRIDEDDVRCMVSFEAETTVFTMVDAILDSRPELAERSLQQLLQDGAAPSQLLAMLARQVQLIVRAKALRDRKTNSNDMQTALGLSQEWLVRKTLEQAARFTPSQLRDLYRRILYADVSIKTGQADPELALTLLAAEMSRGRLSRTGQAVKQKVVSR